MGQRCMKTEKRDSEDNQSINIMSRDFIYRAPFSNPPIELRAGNEALLIKTRLVLSYRKCNIQPKLTSHWSDHQSLYHHQHHHHNHPSQQQCSHHHNHHRQCWRKNWKTKEDSGFIEVDSDELMANESETNCCRLLGDADDDGDQHAINCLSTCRDSAVYQPHRHRRHRHHCCCHDSKSQKQTKNQMHTLIHTSDDVTSAFVSRRPGACFERGFSRRQKTISASSSTESFEEAQLFKSKQRKKRPMIVRCHQEANKIFDVHGQLVRRDITHDRTELQKMIRESFISNKVKFSNSISVTHPS